MLTAMLRMSGVILGCALLAGCAAGGGGRAADRATSASVEREVGAVLDALHEAAARADGAGYFALFADDAVFLGTDEHERWTLAEFRAYAEPLFARGRGWMYRPLRRHVVAQADGWASFDELLGNAKYGVCRGSGSVRRTGGGWKIVQYNLSVPIPNDLLPEVAERIRAFKGSAKP